MIKELFDADGKVVGFLDKGGRLIALGVLWLLGSLPIITIVPSTAALYYAVIKSIRRGQGSAFQEFRRSFRDNLLRGIPLSLTAVGLGAVLNLNLKILQGQSHRLLVWGTWILLCLILFSCVYVGPILSRFRLKYVDVWKLAFLMSLRHIHYTLLILVGAAAIMALQFYFLPIPTILILPGVCCYVATFPIEKALRCYMPEKKENDNAWYYET